MKNRYSSVKRIMFIGIVEGPTDFEIPGADMNDSACFVWVRCVEGLERAFQILIECLVKGMIVMNICLAGRFTGGFRCRIRGQMT